MFNAKQKLFLIALHLCVLPLIPPTSRSQNMTGEKENDRDKVNLSFETKSPPPAVLKPQTNPTLAEYRKSVYDKLSTKIPKTEHVLEVFVTIMRDGKISEAKCKSSSTPPPLIAVLDEQLKSLKEINVPALPHWYSGRSLMVKFSFPPQNQRRVE